MAEHFDPTSLAQSLLAMRKEELAQLPHALLYQARAQIPSEQQGLISPFEHRAFAREAVTENPFMALPIAAAIPLYQLYKSVVGARSQPSLDQVLQGFVGIGEGLSNKLLPSKER